MKQHEGMSAFGYKVIALGGRLCLDTMPQRYRENKGAGLCSRDTSGNYRDQRRGGER